MGTISFSTGKKNFGRNVKILAAQH